MKLILLMTAIDLHLSGGEALLCGKKGIAQTHRYPRPDQPADAPDGAGRLGAPRRIRGAKSYPWPLPLIAGYTLVDLLVGTLVRRHGH